MYIFNVQMLKMHFVFVDPESYKKMRTQLLCENN